MNPPHDGHRLIVDKVKQLAKERNCDYRIIISHSHDHKKNPLEALDKMYFLNKWFPNTNFVLATSELPTMMHHVKALNKDYDNLVIVCGSDRLQEYALLYFKYNKYEYLYKSIWTISVGEREGSISSSKMREWALNDKRGMFVLNTPYTEFFDWSLCHELFDMVRDSLLINIHKKKDDKRDSKKESSKG